MSGGKRGLAQLPAAPAGLSGWPWDVETPPPASDADWPRITVVTPSFKQGQFLEETIRSVLLQGYPNLQYLVIDGNSPDSTRAVLEKYSECLDGWVMEPDRGQSDAINKGLARADGEIFGWLNSDDIYLPGTLQLAGELLREGSGTQWIAGQCRWKEDGQEGQLFASRVDAPLYEWLLASPIQQPASLWRRELFDEVGSIDDSLRYVMDQDLFVRFRLARIPAKYVERELAILRLHPDSKTVSTVPAFRRETINRVLPRYIDRVPATERHRLNDEVALKLLRNARTSLGGRNMGEFAKNLVEGLKWSPSKVASDTLRFVAERVKQLG